MTLVFKDETHQYFEDGIEKPSVTKILNELGITDFSGVPPEVLRKAQNFGTAVHAVTEYHDKKSLDFKSVDTPLIPYLEAWQKFVKDYDFRIITIEQKFYCKKYDYCGTIDRVGTIQNRKTIIDLKSSTSMVPATALQTAGYAIGINEPNITRWAVQLKADATYSVKPYTNPTDTAMFLSCLNVWKWKKANLKK